jgi:hypothetical protein
MPYIPRSPLAGLRTTSARIDVVGYSSANKPPKISGRRRLLIFLGGLFLIVTGGGIMYYYTALWPAQLRIEATSIATVNAYSTKVAATHATATAVARVEAQARATSVVQAAATAEANAIATALSNVYRSATSGKPDLKDSLAKQSAAKWHIYDAVGGGGCTFKKGALHVSMHKKGYYIPCYAKNTHFTNFSFEVQMQWLKGDEGGIIFRASDVANKYYSFTLKRNGSYMLALTKDSRHGIELNNQHSSLINTAARSVNILTVIANGSKLYLYINKHFVGSASDSTLHTGAIALMAADNKQSTEVAFRNLRIWLL